METKMVDVTLHIDETLSADARDSLRDDYLGSNGIMAADYQSEHPHLMVIEYDPDVTDSQTLLALAKQHGIHAELIGL
ncbi:MAG: ATP-binding protein [Thiotrichales bacterium SG8_50]|nr:MAG: ATP-binding protein [Thiotrichales bacterium SG8_50]